MLGYCRLPFSQPHLMVIFIWDFQSQLGSGLNKDGAAAQVIVCEALPL